MSGTKTQMQNAKRTPIKINIKQTVHRHITFKLQTIKKGKYIKEITNWSQTYFPLVLGSVPHYFNLKVPLSSSKEVKDVLTVRLQRSYFRGRV